MIFLIDNQLPLSLVDHLQSHELSAFHVFQRELARSTDKEIWEYAKANNCVIVSKDEDFFHLSGTDMNGPPLVWVRIGNCRNTTLFAAFDFVLPSLLQALNEGSKVIEIRE